MEKTVNTAWYAKKCALGTLVCCGTELVLLMLASALILRGAISEEMANGAVLVCAAVATFLGCMIGARKTSKRAMMTAGCAASAWVTMQAIGFFVYDGLTPERSLELAARWRRSYYKETGKRGEAPRRAPAASAGEHKAIGVFTRF